MRHFGALFAPLFLILAHAAPGQTAGLPGADASGEPKATASAMLTTASPAAYADPSIDVTYYRLSITVAPPSTAIAGRVLIVATSLVDSVNSIGLDLMSDMQVDSVNSGTSRLTFTQFPSVLTVTLDKGYAYGETVAVEVTYHGIPHPTGFGSFEFSQHAGTPWVWTLSQPYGARDWWPCKDHPIDKADSADIFVTCDAAYKVGSNGRLVATTDNGNGTHTVHWAERYPIATYLISVAVTNYAEFTDWFQYSPTDSMPVLNYVLPEHLTDAQQSLPRTIAMLGIFSRTYGQYPFISEKYGHAEFGWGGAMEHQTMTSTTSFDELVIAHELAHQWFGDLITCRTWQHLWLNEGFASYGESVYAEQMYGPAAYRSTIGARLDRALQATGSLIVADTSTVKTLFADRLVYSKGASVLHMLRHVLGDSVFFRALRAYVAQPDLRYSTAITADFQYVCEAVSGVPLIWFFQEWVYGEGHPIYSYTWSSTKGPTAYSVSVRLDQTTGTTNPAFFTMPVDIRMSGPQWDTTVTVNHTVSSQMFTFNTPQQPDSVIIDPDRWILCEIVPSGQVLPTEFSIEQNYPNPFNSGTAVRYALPHRQHVSIRIYDLLGQLVSTLVDGTGEPGSYTVPWDGRQQDGTSLGSGVYLCRFESGGTSKTVKMLLLR